MIVVKVRYLSHDGEYRVRAYFDGKALSAADYFTPDNSDAMGTAELMRAEFARMTIGDLIGLAERSSALAARAVVSRSQGKTIGQLIDEMESQEKS